MDQKKLALKVAARSQKLSFEVEKKIVAQDGSWRLSVYMFSWALEELVAPKGKKKVRKAVFDNPGSRYRFDAFLWQNIMVKAKVTPADTYDGVKTKILEAYGDAADKFIAQQPPSEQGRYKYLHQAWDEDQVFYLNVRPEKADPFQVKGKDFQVNMEWNSFTTYSPGSDFQSLDPSYTGIKSSAPASARKLYLLLKQNPKLLQNMTYNDFAGFLDRNKIGYSHMSSYLR